MGPLSLLSFCLGALALSSEAPFVVAAPGEGVAIHVSVTAEDGTPREDLKAVRLFTNVGTLSALSRVGPGRLSARYTPPPERFPQVALLWTQEGAEHRWLSLPIHGTDILKLSTKPRAQVRVQIGDKTFGPHPADSKGKVEVPIQAPPGLRFATVRSEDLLGNQRARQLDLAPPPFTRVGWFALGKAAELRSTEVEPQEWELFVVTPQGHPEGKARLQLRADAGRLSLVGGGSEGLYRVRYQPSSGSAPGQKINLRAQVPGALPSVQALTVKSGPLHRIELGFASSSYVAGSGGVLPFTFALRDAEGNPVAQEETELRFRAEPGQVEVRSDGTGVVRLDDRFAGRTKVVLRATAGALTAELRAPLMAAEAARAEVEVLPVPLRVGEASEVQLLVKDRFGNLVSSGVVRGQSSRGSLGPVRNVSPGRYQARYEVALPAAAGESTLTFFSASGSVLSRSRWDVLPYLSDWSAGVGVRLGVQSNLNAARSASAALEAHVRPTRAPVEIWGELSGLAYAEARESFEAAVVPHVERVTQLSGLSMLVGARYARPLAGLFALSFSLGLGAQRTFSQMALEKEGEPFLESEKLAPFWGPMARVGVGVTRQWGPGRILGEMSVSYAAGSERVQGNLGGVGWAVGYLWELR